MKYAYRISLRKPEG